MTLATLLSSFVAVLDTVVTTPATLLPTTGTLLAVVATVSVTFVTPLLTLWTVVATVPARLAGTDGVDGAGLVLVTLGGL